MTKLYIYISCISCNQWRYISNCLPTKESRKKYKGRCNKCASKNRAVTSKTQIPGKTINRYGYIRCSWSSFDEKTKEKLKKIVPEYENQRELLEHRIIMILFLNRPLLKSEIVHHINGNKIDNKIENLEVLSRSRHTELHKSIMHELLLLREENKTLKLLLNESLASSL